MTFHFFYKRPSVRRIIEGRNYLNESRIVIRIGIVLGIVAFGVFGLLDPGLLPGQLTTLYAIRYGLVVPVFMVCFLLTFHRLFLRYSQLVSASAAITASIGLTVALSLGPSNSLFQLVYFSGLLIVISFAPSLLRMNIFFTVITTAIAVIYFNLTVEADACIEADQEKCNAFLAKNALLITAGLMGCTSHALFTMLIRSNRQSMLNLTRRKGAIERSRKHLYKMDKVKDKFLFILSHDLRGPIASIRGILNLFYSRSISACELKDHARQLDHLLNEASSLLDNLLHWTVSMHGAMSGQNRNNYNIHHIVSEGIRAYEEHALRKNILLINYVDPKLTLWVDKTAISLIFRNILSNAIKFTEAGEVVVSSRISDDKVDICIKDTGVGMDADAISRLFRWDNLQRTLGTRNESGTGIGLILCKELVESHSGELAVKTKKGDGTIVIITLPNISHPRRSLIHTAQIVAMHTGAGNN